MREKDRELRRRRQRRQERLRGRRQEAARVAAEQKPKGSKRPARASAKPEVAPEGAAPEATETAEAKPKAPRKTSTKKADAKPAKVKDEGEPGEEELRSLLAGREVEVVDFGTHSADRVDYPDVAHAVAQAVADGHLDRAVLVCGTGVGMAIAANKVPGVRAAHASDTYTARLARAHNDAQILTIGGRVLGSGLATELVTVFLDTPFDGGRHADRVAKLEPALPLAGRTVSTP